MTIKIEEMKYKIGDHVKIDLSYIDDILSTYHLSNDTIWVVVGVEYINKTYRLFLSLPSPIVLDQGRSIRYSIAYIFGEDTIDKAVKFVGRNILSGRRDSICGICPLEKYCPGCSESVTTSRMQVYIGDEFRYKKSPNIYKVFGIYFSGINLRSTFDSFFGLREVMKEKIKIYWLSDDRLSIVSRLSSLSSNFPKITILGRDTRYQSSSMLLGSRNLYFHSNLDVRYVKVIREVDLLQSPDYFFYKDNVCSFCLLDKSYCENCKLRDINISHEKDS